MRKNHFTLTAVEALPDTRLRLTYADGQGFEVDLNDWIGATQALAPLRAPAVYAQARLGDFGQHVQWAEGEIELAADNLRNLSVEQAGGIGHERIWSWLHQTARRLALPR